MSSTGVPADNRSEIEHVFRLYSGLALALDPTAGLGGKLLYAGELDAEGCRLVRAANIAGAASLSATADPTAQRLAIREGVIDFLVTSLNEALRILKNEIRKRNAVAVGVTDAAALMVDAMRERGVLPDLVRKTAPGDLAWFVKQGARAVEPGPLPDGCEFRVFANPPANYDARVLTLVPESNIALRRWLRLSPRYLGPQARNLRSLACDEETALKLAVDR